MVSYRLIGTGTTNAQGIARCSNNYVGTGKGEVDIVASTDNPIVEGSLQSETYEIEDCFYVDDGSSSSTLSKYVVYTTDGNTLQISNEALLFTCGTQQMYFNIDTSQSAWNLSDFVGKTVTVKADVNPSYRMKLWIGYQNNGSWSYQDFAWHSTSETLEHSREIPSYATRVILRFECGEHQGDTCILDNLRLWLL